MFNDCIIILILITNHIITILFMIQCIGMFKLAILIMDLNLDKR